MKVHERQAPAPVGDGEVVAGTESAHPGEVVQCVGGEDRGVDVVHEGVGRRPVRWLRAHGRGVT